MPSRGLHHRMASNERRRKAEGQEKEQAPITDGCHIWQEVRAHRVGLSTYFGLLGLASHHGQPLFMKYSSAGT